MKARAGAERVAAPISARTTSTPPGSPPSPSPSSEAAAAAATTPSASLAGRSMGDLATSRTATRAASPCIPLSRAIMR